MNREIIKIDNFHEYEVETIKEGGMGRVLILNRVSDGDEFLDVLVEDHSEFYDKQFFHIYRKKLAIKTFKYDNFVETNRDLFERELNIWIGLDCPNIAKLLKIIYIKRQLFALMPYYNSSLRDIMRQIGRHGIDDAKVVIINIVYGLYEVFKRYKIVHEDIKPENVLADFRKDKFYFFVSDWGIANIQKSYCPDVPSRDHIPKSFVETMKGMGTLPYMSPERFLCYPSHITADIYSIGMIFFELLFGHLPFDYKSGKPLVSQIIDWDYFYIAEDLLRNNFDERVTKVISKSIHPDMTKRYADYKQLVLDVHNINIKRKSFFF